MNKFLTVLQFELTNYFKNKSYMITTLLIAILFGALLFLPSIFDMSDMLGTAPKKETVEQSQEVEDKDTAKENKTNTNQKQLVIYDEAGILEDMTVLNEVFSNTNWNKVNSSDEVKNMVEKEEAKAGFVVKGYKEYDYYVYNKGMSDSTKANFEVALSNLAKQDYCEANNLNYEELEATLNGKIVSTETVLGKNMVQNYWYCYALVIMVFMVIIFYGVMIATSITTEKSNRSIEVLVTSADANCLLFGKVIAGAIASIFQVGVILGAILISYQINIESWGHMLDMVLNIPGDVLITFGFFGIGGYLFYAFIYGAVGALVSKTEDINKSAGGVQMVVMLVYFAVLFQLQNIDGIVVKVLSFLPISSYSAMFARVAMGNVAMWEVVVSFVILVVSIIAVGMLGAKIYRMGTLRYGNPIKFSNALKLMKQK